MLLRIFKYPNFQRLGLLSLGMVIWLFFVINILHLIATYWVNLFFYDSWPMVPIFQHYLNHTLSFNDFWSPYFMFRPVVTRFMWLIIFKFFHGSILLSLFVPILIQTILLLVVIFQFQKIVGVKTLTFWLMFVVFTALIFALSMGDTWIYEAFQEKTITPLFFALAIFSIDLKTNRYLPFLLSMLWAVIASLDTPNGLIIWPTMLMLLVINRSPWRQSLFYGLVGIVLIWIYSIHLVTIPNFYGSVPLIQRLGYILCFPANIFSAGSPHIALAIGSLALLVYIFCSIIIFTARFSKLERQQIFPWLALGMLTIGSGFFGAIGRIGSGMINALWGRYMPLSVPFWIGLLVTLLIICKKFNLNRFKSTYLIIIIVASLLTINYWKGISVMINFENYLYQQRKLSTLAVFNESYIVNPTTDLGYLGGFFQWSMVLEYSNFLKQHHLVMFRQKAPTVIGNNVTNIGLQIANVPINGNFQINKIAHADLDTCAYSYHRAFSVQGQIPYEVLKKRQGEKIYMLDNKGTIYGLGLFDLAQLQPKYVETWNGFVVPDTVDSGAIELHAYIKFTDSNQIYPISETQLLPRGLGCKL